MFSPFPPSTVRVAALEGLGEMLGQAGVDFEPLLRRQGIDPAMLREPDNRLAYRQFVQTLDAAAAAIGDDCLGLHLGAAQSIHVAGVLGYALRASPDVRTQLLHASRYYALHQDGAEIGFQENGELATFRYTVLDPHVVAHRHDAEATLALCVSQWRLHIAQPKWAPSSVHFTHPAPSAAAMRELRAFFGCPIHFSDSFDGLRFPASFLSSAISTADPGLHQILSRYAEECLARHADTQTSTTGRVRHLIAAGLSNGHASIEEIATRMAVTPRTLQRRLADEGQQFSELLDETRRELATQYLRDPALGLIDAAFLVGYSDLTAFHRAFKRWFNQTPLDYQRQHQQARPLSS